MASDERTLAAWLAARDDDALVATFTARAVPGSVGWSDFFDAAAGLLDETSIDRALSRLPRAALIALLRGAETGGRAAVEPRLALTDAEGRPFDAVAARVRAAAARHPEAFASDPADALPAEATDDRGEAIAAERAFASAGSLADLLAHALHAPLARTGAGALAATDRKRMVESGTAASPDDIDDLVAAAHLTNLLADAGDGWSVSEDGRAWLPLATPERWRFVASAFLRALPDGVRTSSGAASAPARWARAYPLDPAWPARAERIARVSEAWGLFAPDGTRPRWTPATGVEPDAATLGAALPTEVDRLYLQADLTAIAPGPLAAPLDLRLRGIAQRESRALASSYRFTAASLGAGMTEGETAASIREFLGELSLTGIPQPLDYLIDSTAARHGLVRVVADPATGRTRVESADAALLDTLAVDQTLRPLGLLHDEAALTSRVGRDAVFWALADARYPVVAIDANGEPESMRRRTVWSRTTPGTATGGAFDRLIAVLRASHGDDADAAWLGRELEQAVRARATVVVTVRMPDGAERAFTLEASGLGGGRLRGRDRGADIERTLPVSSIIAVARNGAA